MTRDGPALGTNVVHRCGTVAATGGREVIHVVLPPRRPTGIPVTDIRDAGYRILAAGVLPGEIPDCPAGDAYPGCQHLLLRPRDDDAPNKTY